MACCRQSSSSRAGETLWGKTSQDVKHHHNLVIRPSSMKVTLVDMEKKLERLASGSKATGELGYEQSVTNETEIGNGGFSKAQVNDSRIELTTSQPAELMPKSIDTEPNKPSSSDTTGSVGVTGIRRKHKGQSSVVTAVAKWRNFHGTGTETSLNTTQLSLERGEKSSAGNSQGAVNSDSTTTASQDKTTLKTTGTDNAVKHNLENADTVQNRLRQKPGSGLAPLPHNVEIGKNDSASADRKLSDKVADAILTKSDNSTADKKDMSDDFSENTTASGTSGNMQGLQNYAIFAYFHILHTVTIII